MDAGVGAQAPEHLRVHAGDARRGFAQSLAVGLFADRQENLADRALNALQVDAGNRAGFAVSLGLGILTTIVTAVTMTRMMIALWYRWAKPKTLPI